MQQEEAAQASCKLQKVFEGQEWVGVNPLADSEEGVSVDGCVTNRENT